MIDQSVEALIGATPALELTRIGRPFSAKILVKIEGKNPFGSVKDRVAKAMLDDAEQKGLLKPGGVIIEPTSGNTGIALCALAAARGYKAIIVMPDTMSKERISLMKAYGATVELTEGAKGMKGAADRAQALAGQIPGSLIPGQFDNPANPKAHFETTGPELFEAAGGSIDWFVAGVGTGGTISGVGRYLKSRSAAVQVAAVEPAESPLLSQGKAGAHKIQGIGANFLPAVLDRGVIDEIITVTGDEAIQMTRALAREEGILAGVSAGANVSAALKLAARPENEGKTIATILPDTGERYLSNGVFE